MGRKLAEWVEQRFILRCLLKSYVLFQDHDSYRMFEEAYSAIDATTRQGDWFADVDMCRAASAPSRGGRVDGVRSTLSTADARRRRHDATPPQARGQATAAALRKFTSVLAGLQVHRVIWTGFPVLMRSGRSGATGAPCRRIDYARRRLVATRLV